MVVLLKILVLWAIMLCHWVHSSWHYKVQYHQGQVVHSAWHYEVQYCQGQVVHSAWHYEVQYCQGQVVHSSWHYEVQYRQGQVVHEESFLLDCLTVKVKTQRFFKMSLT